MLITFALGIPLVIVARYTTTGDFFKTRVIAYTSIEDDDPVEPEPEGATP